MALQRLISILFFSLLFSNLTITNAFATPSSTFWAPSTASCQSWAVPHITYDTYFASGASAGNQGAPNYPTDTGLTVGFLPYGKVQGELGYDLLLPSHNPLLLNAKLCTPESTIFPNAPALSFGIYNWGFKKDVTDYNVLHVMLQKAVFGNGGYIAAGVYRGLNKTLLTGSDGNVHQDGFIGAINSPEIQIGLKGLKKINFATDIQTGRNVLGAWGFGSYLYFTDDISLLTGPVFFFDKPLQPGGRNMLWTAQLDVNIPLEKLTH